MVKRDSRTIKFRGNKYRPKKTSNGYYNIRTTDPRTRLSRDMWEFHTSDTLKPTEIIHHINEDTLDDRMDNFVKQEWGEHSRKHLTGIKRSQETCNRISKGKSKPNPVRSRNIRGGNNPNWKGGKSNSYKYRKLS